MSESNQTSGSLMLPCSIHKVLYSKDGSDYKVFLVTINAPHKEIDSFIEKGMPEHWEFDKFVVQVNTDQNIKGDTGYSYIFTGNVVKHSKYGYQFQADFVFAEQFSANGISSTYLETLPHIGKSRAKCILTMFASKSIVDIFNDSPEELLQIAGITPRRLEKIKSKWREDAALREIYLWLNEHGVPPSIMSKIVSQFGVRAIDLLEENPYLLVGIRGVNFVRADLFAHEIMEEVPYGFRISSCINYILEKAKYDGHLCLPMNECVTAVRSILSEVRSEENFFNKFKEVVRENYVGVKNNGSMFIYSPFIFARERHVANSLYDLSTMPSCHQGIDSQAIMVAQEELREHFETTIILDDCQIEAISSVFDNKITVITGGGGTGKSTICRCIKTIANEENVHVTFMTPTGAAAKVLESKTGSTASTIHRALKLAPGAIDIGEDVRISSGLLVIDEFSMVGIDTLPLIMSAIRAPREVNIVLIGDPQQLPSVSAGNFLEDIIHSGIANVVTLNKIHRQSERSYISKIAKDISSGEYPHIPDDAEDIEWMKSYCGIDTLDDVKNIVALYLKKHGNLDGLQFLSPIKKEQTGVFNLCKEIQSIVHKDQDHAVVSYDKNDFYVGDRIMQTVNNYNKDVFNGNIGHVIDVGSQTVYNDAEDKDEEDKSDKTFIDVDFDGNILRYTGTEIKEIMVCWCCTVHKFQGSQVKTAALLLNSKGMMSRELVYTGITRASEKLYLIGPETMMQEAVAKSIIKKRYTNTKEMLSYLNNDNAEQEVSFHNVELCES